MIIHGFSKKHEEELKKIVYKTDRSKKIMTGNVSVKPLHKRFSKHVAGNVECWERNGKKDITLRLSPRVFSHKKKEELILHEIEHVRQHKSESLKSMRKPITEKRKMIREAWANTLADDELRKRRWIL